MIYQACKLENFDTVTMTCSSPEWVSSPGFLPNLSVQDAFLLSSLVIGVWAVGYSFKIIRKMMGR